MKLTQQQLLDMATERFGPNPLDWKFQCPSCKDVASGHDFAAALEANPRRENGQKVIATDIYGQECVGRAFPLNVDRGCFWAADGFIPGPWTIVMPDGKSIAAFALAEASEVSAR